MEAYEAEGQPFRPSALETIIGSGEQKRSTKTYIGSEASAILLEMIENHAQNAVETLQAMVYDEEGVELSKTEVLERFRGARRWVQLHQGLIEHYASLHGFSVQAVVSMERARMGAREEVAESSVTE